MYSIIGVIILGLALSGDTISPVPSKLSQRNPASKLLARPAAKHAWTIPFSCEDVRWYFAHFSREALNEKRIAAGLPEPTADQWRQISICIGAK